MAVRGLAHAAIQAKDYRATLNFYQEALGFRVAHSWSLPAFSIREASLLVSPDKRTCIEVFGPEADIPAQGRPAAAGEEIVHGALLHLAFYVDDAEQSYRHAIACGAKPLIGPEVLALGNPVMTVRNALVHSPNGEVLEFMEEIDFDSLRPDSME
ncbi:MULTISPECIES: VOC family protein [unclassified Paenibacillus]|uniref:VOC family protein n=1 Tax=unclassified Paenibacillus TaxID=185978 RepID=UPI0009547600|nr:MULTISPECIES: VOC family protein [unclassified Paenibacillus]ASS67501.1 VOC family protein [Paenibacillus sp. RUD330]SIQ74737.1 Catechol 2,3-dioxygenase [Paenibacillus sp. RU4X]SIQ96186.1 Catechol 2,3-dioxygenase [Paenibacillus sp. RU4T]